jgi:hypothetical protein
VAEAGRALELHDEEMGGGGKECEGV